MPHLLQRSRNSTRTEPTTEPVTPEELRARARLLGTEHDEQLREMIVEARTTIELSWIRQAIMHQTCIDTFDFLSRMELRWSPVSSITSVVYLDGDGDSQTLATSVYELANENGLGVVRLKNDQVWPTTQSHEDVVTVTYVAGFGATPDDVPPPIKSAIMALAEWKYGGACDEDLRRSIEVDLDPYTRREYA